MTRTKRFATEPSRSPLQSRAGVLLNLIFPDLRRPAASSKRNQAAARSAAAAASTTHSGTLGPGAAGQQLDREESLGVARSCSPTLAGCSTSQQPQLPSSLLHLASLDADNIGGLSDLLDDDEADHLTLPGGQPAAAAAAAAAAAGAGSQHAAASALPAMQQQQPGAALRGGSPGPAAAAEAAAEQHASVDGTAYIVERPTPAAAAAAPEDADGFTAVDKMLEQLSVDVMLDQQYLLEEQQHKQRQSPAATAAAGGSAAHLTSSSRSGAGMPYPTGPAAALAPAAAAAAGPAGAPLTHSGSHQVPISMAAQQQAAEAAGTLPTVGAVPDDHNVSQPAVVGEGQQQQQQQDPALGNQPGVIPQAWQLHHSFSAPVLHTHAGATTAAGEQAQHMTNNVLHDSSDRPFSFQDLLMSDEPAASTVNTSMGPGFDNQQQQRQQQQQTWAPYHQSQAPQLHSTHSAPLPLAAPTLPHHRHSHPSYGPASSPNQQQQHLQQGMHPHPLGFRYKGEPPIPFYQHQHQHHQQQMYAAQHGSSFPGQSGTGLGHTVSPHQAELEALKQQIAEEKRRRKERKQLKKMRKIMMQQQQQQQGLAQQVLYAASSQQQLPPPPGTHAAGTLPRPRGMPHPPWPPAAPPHQQQQQRRYPGMQGEAAGPNTSTTGPYSGPYHSCSVGRGTAGSPRGAAAAVAAAAAARQHAVAQSLRQLAHKSEQMHRAGAGQAATAIALRELPNPADRRSLTVLGVGSNTGGSSSSRYGSYGNSSSRPPVPQAAHEADMYMCSINSSSMSPARAAAGLQGQLPAAAGAVVLDLQHNDPQQHHHHFHQQQQQVLADARLDSFHRSSSPGGEFSKPSMPAPGAATDDASAGVAGWMHGSAAAAGSSPPASRSLMGLDLRSAESARQQLGATTQRRSADAAMQSGRDVLAAAGAAAIPRAASADAMGEDARMRDAAAFQQHSAGNISSSTKLLGQAAVGNAVTAAEAAAAASPVSTTSSRGRKRSWQQAAAAADATILSGHHMGHDDEAHPHYAPFGSPGGLQAMSCDQSDQQQQQQQPQQRQQRLLQLPFNGPDLAERRPLVTTEPPAIAKQVHHQQLPAAATHQDAPGTSSAAAAAAAEAGAADPCGDTTAAAAACDAVNKPAATTAAELAAAAAAPAGIGSPDSSSMCTSSDKAFQRPKAIGPRAAKAPRGADSGSASSSSRARGEAAGLTSPGLSSGPGRQQSFSEATAAAAAAAAAAVGGSGGSGDLGGYLGGFGSPGVYRTSSGKVLRMLTHPVTGKPLLLGPAVDAKSSRLGNTSLGAPAPQLFGMDLQSTHLNSMPAPYPHTPAPPPGLAPPAAAAAGYLPAGFAPAAVPGLSSPTTSSTRGRQALRRDGGGCGSIPGVGSAAMSGVEAAGVEGAGGAAGVVGGYCISHASSGYGVMQLQPGMHAPAGQQDQAGFAEMGMNMIAGGLDFGGGMVNSNMHAAASPAMWGQQPPQQQQQLGFDDDGLVSFEQLQQFELQPVQFGSAAPMDFTTPTPEVSQDMAALPGLGFE